MLKRNSDANRKKCCRHLSPVAARNCPDCRPIASNVRTLHGHSTPTGDIIVVCQGLANHLPLIHKQRMDGTAPQMNGHAEAATGVTDGDGAPARTRKPGRAPGLPKVPGSGRQKGGGNHVSRDAKERFGPSSISTARTPGHASFASPLGRRSRSGRLPAPARWKPIRPRRRS